MYWESDKNGQQNSWHGNSEKVKTDTNNKNKENNSHAFNLSTKCLKFVGGNAAEGIPSSSFVDIVFVLPQQPGRQNTHKKWTVVI